MITSLAHRTANTPALLMRCPTSVTRLRPAKLSAQAHACYSAKHPAHVTPNPLPAQYLRGGTSKGVFILQKHMPSNPKHWGRILLGLMGSPDKEYGRQLNGMGGGVSSLSKAVVVGPPSDAQREAGIDCVYTFVQVGISDDVLDTSGNCGNLSSMVGVFALDEGLVRLSPRHDAGVGPAGKPLVKLRAWNTNTSKVIDTTFPVTHDAPGPMGTAVARLDLRETTMSGVPGKASRILLDFVDPAGARTGKLLPSGSPVDTVEVQTPDGRTASVKVSLVDATNPTVFLSLDDLLSARAYPGGPLIAWNDPAVLGVMEGIRRAGAALMGLDPAKQAQPKVAALHRPLPGSNAHIVIHAFSMGVLHKAVPMTVGLCLGVASRVEGTIAYDIVREARNGRAEPAADAELVRIEHPSGLVEVGASFDETGDVRSAKVVRTGRRLMRGEVWW